MAVARTNEQETKLFGLEVLRVVGTGLSRVVDAQLSNTGMQPATGVQVVVELHTEGRRLKVSGQDSLRVDIGSLEVGVAVECRVELRFALLEGLQLQSSGVDIVVTVHSDQGEEIFRARYNPVTLSRFPPRGN